MDKEKNQNYPKSFEVSLAIRGLLLKTDPVLIGGILSQVDMKKDGGHLLQAAIHLKKPEIVKLLIAKGADVKNPPREVPPLVDDP